MGTISASILDEDRHRRLRAVDELELDVAGLHALRTALVLDEDASIRERAAERLGSAEATRAAPVAGAAIAEALADALRDASPAVREAAARTAGRRRAEGLTAQLAEMTRLDPSFRARRAALRALADAAGERAIPALSDALDDPFWRVRYAAIQVLARWPHATLGAEPASARRRAAIAYLESVWSGALALDVAPSEPAVVEADPLARSEIEDDDPAVTSARVSTAAARAVRGADLVAFLANPHASLRRVASRRLVERGDTGELLAALAWLDEPRVPYASGTVTRLLARVHTRPLVLSVLTSASAGAGALAWALDEAARRDHDALVPAALRAVEHVDVRVRRAAVRALAVAGATEALLVALRDDDEECRAEATGGLAAGDVPASSGGLLVERTWIAMARQSAPEDALRTALDSTWASVRAEATAELARRGRLGHEARELCASDPDPWIRAAALDVSNALPHLELDPDPTVRRAALRALLRGRAAASAADRQQVARVAVRSDDPWIRARAADLLDGADDDDLVAVLLLTRDRASMVRAAAADVMDRLDDPVSRCARLLDTGATLPEDVRLAAHAQLLREPDARGQDALTRELDSPDLSPRARETLLAMRLLYPDAPALPVVATRKRPEPSPGPEPARVAKRALGNTGLAVAPLGISGAFELPGSCLEAAREAGVDLFFWEPSHRELTRFVAHAPRRSDLVITAGSYEADARSIERDVDRALGRLGVDALGVMLLFWVRSRARLTDEAFATLERLKERGKVRAIGFSTHLRDVALEAIEARPWDVIMIRHSAAHPGAERALLPAAAARGVGVIAFSALLYGRMLTDPRSGDAVTAADCYRYSVSQPGVSVCLSAPRRFRELEDNLEVLRRPLLDAAAIERLRAHGARVHAQNRAFTTLVRQPV